MNYIIENYSDEYNILFKPHPAWMPTLEEGQWGRWESRLGKERLNEWHDLLTNRVNYLEENNITVLPGQTPIEAILWSYPEVKIGGYNSSLYMNASAGQVKFFILKAEDYNLLSSPLPSIIDAGSLDDTETNKAPIIISPALFLD